MVEERIRRDLAILSCLLYISKAIAQASLSKISGFFFLPDSPRSKVFKYLPKVWHQNFSPSVSHFIILKKKIVENMIRGFSLFRSIDNRKAVIENSIDPLRWTQVCFVLKEELKFEMYNISERNRFLSACKGLLENKIKRIKSFERMQRFLGKQDGKD